MEKNKMKRIAISTGGGDAPGLNAVIRSVVLSALNRGWKCYGIRDGFHGIMFPERYSDGGIIQLTETSVRGITHLGGTIIGTASKGNPLSYPIKGPDGTIKEIDRTDEIVDAFRRKEIDALISIGGDGSLAIANALAKKGLDVIGVPKTIDNDLEKTVVTFGFNTAVFFATSCIDRLNSTAEAHQRVMIVEVMGRYAGWIALESGVASGAEVILIPEIPFSYEKIKEKIMDRDRKGRNFSIVVVAEGAVPRGGKQSVVEHEAGRQERLGGIGETVGRELAALTGKDTRVVVLGHLLRGGSPTAYDRLICLRFGAAAVRAIEQGKSGVMVALDPPNVHYVPLDQVTKRMKKVPLNSDTILTARDLGISFGD